MEQFKPARVKPTITSDLLDKIDIHVGTIQAVEDIKGSQKVVRLIVDFGDHERTILAGMKTERENVNEIEGKQALFVVNLEAKRIMGEKSEGLLVDIGYVDGVKPALAVPETEVPNGVRCG